MKQRKHLPIQNRITIGTFFSFISLSSRKSQSWSVLLLLCCVMLGLEILVHNSTGSRPGNLPKKGLAPGALLEIESDGHVSTQGVYSVQKGRKYGHTNSSKYLKPNPNVKTIALRSKRFPSGFRNQMMAFNAFVMWADELGYGQILLQRVGHADTFGTNKLIRHQDLYDVQHWNSYYPALPRMVLCDPTIHVDFDCATNQWKSGVDLESLEISPKRLEFFPHELMYSYMHYTRGKGPLMKIGVFPNKVDLLIMQGALRPCPELMELVKNKLRHLDGGKGNNDYMTLHLRVEPDMQRHPLCKSKKVIHLKQILAALEAKFPIPPATCAFIPINRQYLEQEGYPNKSNPKLTNWVAVENLKILNHAVKHGLWNGTVKVFEFGANALNGTRFAKRPSTTGALLNFYIASNANIFVGTEVSSYSHDLAATRFYAGNVENYRYTPDGVVEWTTETTKQPPEFEC